MWELLSLVPRPYILILLEYGLVCKISMEPMIVGVSMGMPSFTMTSFQSARGQVDQSSLVEVLSVDTDGRIAS